MIKIGINGACGKMGKRIIALAQEDKGLAAVVALESSTHPSIGQVCAGLEVTDDTSKIAECDCLIDFSAPLATTFCLEQAVKFKKPLVIGTTGLESVQQEKIKEASKTIPIVFSPNMSVGVNLLFKVLKIAASILKNYEVNIEEAHHIHKKDSPSGTAKKIVQIINEQGFSIKNEEVKAIREGEIVGDHKIVFESQVDKIELSHSAKTRDIFAKGALLAAQWLVNKGEGLYSMDDVLFGNKKEQDD